MFLPEFRWTLSNVLFDFDETIIGNSGRAWIHINQIHVSKRARSYSNVFRLRINKSTESKGSLGMKYLNEMNRRNVSCFFFNVRSDWCGDHIAEPYSQIERTIEQRKDFQVSLSAKYVKFRFKLKPNVVCNLVSFRWTWKSIHIRFGYMRGTIRGKQQKNLLSSSDRRETNFPLFFLCVKHDKMQHL